MAFLIVLGVIAFLVVMVAVGLEFNAIASEKGFESSRYFWYVFLLGFIGMAMIIALPDRNFSKVIQKKEDNHYVVRTPAANEWKCSKCGKINQDYVGTCGCGEKRK